MSLVNAPWETRSDVNTLAERPFVVLPGDVTRVSCDVLADALPCVGEWVDQEGKRLKRFELPASISGASGGSVCEEIRLHWSPRRPEETDVRLEIAGQLPRLKQGVTTVELDDQQVSDGTAQEIANHDSDGEVESDQSTDSVAQGDASNLVDNYLVAAAAVERLIDRHVDWVNRLFEELPESVPTGDWQGIIGGLALRRVQDVAAIWRAVGESDQPRMALIVKLSRELPDILERVCRSPRRVLRRERQMQNLGRVREVDAGCLRWLARQPGVTVAERAGSRQQTLAIVRVEDVDTPENRVVRDLLSRAARACARYLREHSGSGHERVQDVRKFRRQLRSLMKSSPINEASLLVGIPQPNYVLQMDSRYSVLWLAYQQLVRQQQLEDSVWRWRHRLFSEHLQIGFVAALNEMADSSLTHGGDVVLQREQNCGQFIDSRSALGPWWLRESSEKCCVDLVRSDQLQLHPLIPQELASLSPDFVFVKRRSSIIDQSRSPSSQPQLAAVWSALSFRFESSRLDNHVHSLADALSDLNVTTPVRCMLIQPTLDTASCPPLPTSELVASAAVHSQPRGNQMIDNPTDTKGDSQNSGIWVTHTQVGNCRGLRFKLPLQHHAEEFVRHLEWALGVSTR